MLYLAHITDEKRSRKAHGNVSTKSFGGPRGSKTAISKHGRSQKDAQPSSNPSSSSEYDDNRLYLYRLEDIAEDQHHRVPDWSNELLHRTRLRAGSCGYHSPYL